MLITKKLYTLDEIKEKVIPIAIEHSICKVTLFGSYARGTATEYSDIDFCVLLPDKGIGFLYFSLIESLQEAFVKRIDIVLENNFDNEPNGLEDIIKKEGILLYEQKY